MRWIPVCLGSLALLASCSLVVDDDPKQCETTADCTAKGGAFVGSICSPQKVCSPCTTNAQCLAGGKVATCVRADGRCHELFTPECSDLVRGPSSDDDTKALLAKENILVIGALLKDDGARDVHEQRLNSMKLALGDILLAGGIPSDSGPQSIAALVCDSADEPLIRSTKHLAEDLKVPVIIGPSFSGRVIRAANEVTVKAGTLLIAPSATSPAITSLADDGLVWRTAPSDALQAVPLRLQIPALEQSLRARYPAIKDVRLAVMVKGDAYGTALSGLLVPSAGEAPVLLNGKPLDPSAPYFRSIVYPPETGPREEDRTALKEFAPHIVALLGTTETVSGIIAPLESSGAAAGWNPGILPEYVFSDGGKGEVLLDAARSSPNLAARVRGTVPAYRGPVYDAFVSAYRGAFGAAPTAFGTAGTFDAAYLTAFSLATLDGKQPTGALLAQGLSRIVSGPQVEARFTELAGAFASLRSGASINFSGASGTLDFDLATGEAVADIDVWCVSTASGGPAFASSGVFYAGATKTVEGVFACPK
jgi:branched-chain amino acid transport system substrate-binding protein